MEVVLYGIMEVFLVIFVVIIIIVVVFFGFFFVDGNLGEFGVELVIVVIISLIFFLVEGIFIFFVYVVYSKVL